MNKVFVSYSRRNKNIAERLARDLSDAGLEVWIDFRQIHGGEMWENEIYRGLQRSDVLVLCLSPDAVASEWVQREVNTAREQNKFIMPIMIVNALDQLRRTPALNWVEQLQYIDFENRYEEAFPQLLQALPGKRRINAFDDVPVEDIPNPFKGLEAFQQTDAAFFFGRENLISKALKNMQRAEEVHFLPVVGASGSGKSSLVRAGIIPQLRHGVLPGSEKWRLAIFTPGEHPINALAVRLAPFLEYRDAAAIEDALKDSTRSLRDITDSILRGTSRDVKLLLVIDQFEEVFTRAGDAEATHFLNIIHDAATDADQRSFFIITMRADFFDRLGRYPQVAELFEQENMLIVTEMTASNLLRTIEGPAQAVGLVYEDGLSARILDDVRRQPGSLPLLQYALKSLYEQRSGRKLTHAAYDAIGGVQKALAGHAERIYQSATPAEQDIMRRIFLRIVEVSEGGEITRRRVTREELQFSGVPDAMVQQVVDRLTAPEARLLIASREITSSETADAPVTRLEVCHEALIREWERYQSWIQENLEDLRISSDILRQANDWVQRERDASYLLRGARLMQAEEWIVEADANAIQREFVRASVAQRTAEESLAREQAERELALQRTAANRLRLIAVVLVLALIGAVALTLFALNERANAEENARLADASAVEAERNAAEARSFALSANAERALGNDDNDLALALAIDSALVVSQPPPETRLSLANVAFAPGPRRVLDDGSGVVINAAGLAPDGAWLFTGDDNGVISVWSAATGERIKTIMPPASAQEGDQGGLIPAGAITDIAVAGDGKTLVVSTGSGDLYTVDYRSDTYLKRYTGGHNRAVNMIALNADATKVLSASSDTTIVLWDVESTAIDQTLRGHRTSVIGVYFDPRDANSALSLSRDGTLIRWNLINGEAVQQTPLNITAVSLAVSANGQWVAAGGTRGVLQLWQRPRGADQTPTLTRTFLGITEEAIIRALAFSPDGDWLASAGTDETIAVWDTATGARIRLLTGHTRDINDLSVNPAGTRMISASRDGSARLWDLTNAAIVRDFVGHDSASVGVYMPQGRAILSGSSDRTLRLWDIATGRTIHQLRGHIGAVLSVDVSADGQRIISAGRDNTLRLWTLDGAEPLILRGHTDTVNVVRFLPGDAQAVSVGRDGGVIVWDLTRAQELTRYLNPQRAAASPQFALDISADGRLIAAGGDDQVITVWDRETNRVIQTLRGHERSVRALAFSPDGRRVVSGTTNGDLILWDVETGAQIRSFNGHNRTIQDIDFSPDGAAFVSASGDGTIRVWDAETGFEIRIYEMEDPQVSLVSVKFSANGDTILSGLSDGRVRLWRLYPTVEALLAWTLVNRHVPELTCDQRVQFRLPPYCTPEQPEITRTLPDLPQIIGIPPTLVALEQGMTAVVNVTDGENLRLRSAPTLADNATIIALMPTGTRVTLQEGPRISEGLVWWRVQTESGAEGWAAESLPASLPGNASGNLQMLIPEGILGSL